LDERDLEALRDLEAAERDLEAVSGLTGQP
jgi:hypothetical protein